MIQAKFVSFLFVILGSFVVGGFAVAQSSPKNVSSEKSNSHKKASVPNNGVIGRRWR